MLALSRRRLIPIIAALVTLTIFVLAIASAWSPEPAALKMSDHQQLSAEGPPNAPSASAAPALEMPMPAAYVPAPPDGEATGSTVPEPNPIEVSVPRLANTYGLGFRLAGDRIAPAQDAHRKLCQRMGPARCQLLALDRGAAEDTQTRARLKVRVATVEAERLSDQLIAQVAQAGGRAIATRVMAADVSKDIVDAEARIRQRELLVSRLTDILRTRNGKVAELVEAERSVAQAQEELDQAKGRLTELRGRVAMADMEITYEAAAAQPTRRETRGKLSDAIAGSGAVFVAVLRGLLMMLIYLAPWLATGVPATLALLHFRRSRTAPTPE